MEKCGKFWKNGRFSGRIWPDWGNTTRADMARLGSIGFYGEGGCKIGKTRDQNMRDQNVQAPLETGDVIYVVNVLNGWRRSARPSAWLQLKCPAY